MIFFVNLKTLLENPVITIVIVCITVIFALIAYNKSVKSRKYYRETHNKWIWIQGVLLFLLEPQKIRLLKELFHA